MPHRSDLNAPLRVLLVEDNPVNQEIGRETLLALGCDVAVVGDGGAAVAAVVAGGVDLVLMDCQMPGMDGYTATRRIRAEERLGREARAW